MANQELKSMTSNTDEPALNRRRLLKAAVATAPVIATLPSGAALARSSNIIGPTSGSAKDSKGRTLCLNRNSGTPVGGGRIDLGPRPSGQAVAIRERDYRTAGSLSADPISEKAMCQQGGQFQYWNSGSWKTVDVPRGMAVSAMAMASFAGSIYTKEV
jgi:hypothetical protein